MKDVKRGFTKYVVIFLSGISRCGWILALNPVWVPTGPDWPPCQPVSLTGTCVSPPESAS